MAGKNRLMARLVATSATITPDSDYIATNLTKTQPTAVGLSVYSSIDSLPTSAATGTKAFVTSNNTLYFYNSGWYKIAIINSFNPQWITEPNSNYTLDLGNIDSELIITVLANDSDEVPITYSVVLDSDANQLINIVHDSDKDNKWRVSLQDSDEGSGSVTFRASDGVNLVSALSTFTFSLTTYVLTPTNAYSYLNTNRADGATVTTNNVDTWVIAGGGRWANVRTGNLLNVPGYNSGDTFWSVIEYTSMGIGFSTRSGGGWAFYSDASMTTGLDGDFDSAMRVRSDTMDVENENNGTNDREVTYTPPGATSEFVMAMYFDGDKSAQYWVSTDNGSTWLGPVQTHTWSAAPAAISMYCYRRDDDGSPQSMILRDPSNYTLPTITL